MKRLNQFTSVALLVNGFDNCFAAFIPAYTAWHKHMKEILRVKS